MVSSSTAIELVVCTYITPSKASILQALGQSRRSAAKLGVLDLTDRMGTNMLKARDLLALKLNL